MKITRISLQVVSDFNWVRARTTQSIQRYSELLSYSTAYPSYVTVSCKFFATRPYLSEVQREFPEPYKFWDLDVN